MNFGIMKIRNHGMGPSSIIENVTVLPNRFSGEYTTIIKEGTK
jgi:hypothetical protein